MGGSGLSERNEVRGVRFGPRFGPSDEDMNGSGRLPSGGDKRALTSIVKVNSVHDAIDA